MVSVVAGPSASLPNGLLHPLSVMLDTLNRTHDPAVDGDAIEQSFGRAYKLRRPQSPCRVGTGSSDVAEPPSVAATSSDNSGPVRATCADLLAGRASAFVGVKLVLGISTAPDKWGIRRRVGIRETWLRFPAVGRTVVSCFVLGRRQVKPRHLEVLDAEQARHDDIAWLNQTLDGQGPFTTITKVHHWYRLATELLGLVDATTGAPVRAALASTTIRHIAKVDDDTFLNLPVLQADLHALGCTSSLYYGVFAFGGYNPRTYLKCGFDYSEKGARYRRYGCAGEAARKGAGAAHPPFPFTCGSLMLASTALIVRVATEPAIGRFVARSESEHHTDEDVAMGFWLSRYHLAGDAVTYVRVNERLANLACFHQKGLYKRPTPAAVGVHFVKTASGMRYVWGVVHDGQPSNATRCREMTGDGRL